MQDDVFVPPMPDKVDSFIEFAMAINALGLTRDEAVEARVFLVDDSEEFIKRAPIKLMTKGWDTLGNPMVYIYFDQRDLVDTVERS